jgi:hypothetical protein
MESGSQTQISRIFSLSEIKAQILDIEVRDGKFFEIQQLFDAFS